MNELLWHPRTSQLVAHLQRTLPQGLIIDGPSGIGVVATAKYLAAAAGAQTFVIEPKKSKDGKMVVDKEEGNIIIDDIRQLYEQTRTSQAATQVYIFDTGERSMTTAAQNAFLKLLEEPRAGLHFIIATHHSDQLLPTIMSRSQRLSLLPLTNTQVDTLITELTIDDPVKRARLAFVGNGLPALIKRLAADDTAYERRVELMSDAKTMLAGALYQKIVTIHRRKDNRADALTLLDDMNHQLKVILQSKPDTKLARDINRYLEARQKILAGGNIRLQLTSAVLQ